MCRVFLSGRSAGILEVPEETLGCIPWEWAWQQPALGVIPKVFRLFFLWKIHSKESRAQHIPEKLGCGEMRGSCRLGKLPAFPGLEFMGTNSSEKSGMCSQGGFSQSFPKVFLPRFVLATLPFEIMEKPG